VISAALAPIATQLPANTSVLRLAAVCRSAFLLFMRGSDKWGKGELADWLTNHYARATCLDEEPAPSERKPSQSVQPHALRLLMRHARMDVLRGVEELLEHREDAPFLSRLVFRGYIVPVRDAAGGTGYAPTKACPMTLADRVLSLLAADFLTVPHQYASSPPSARSRANPISEPPPTGVRMKRPNNL
jgi:hypothetical protein